MKRFLVTIFIAVIPIVFFLAWYTGKTSFFPFIFSDTELMTIQIDRTPILVEIADTPEARRRGLSGRESLPSVNGLLLVFDTFEPHGIWMKDMLFPIDIIWIAPSDMASSGGEGESLRIVDVKYDVSPDSFPTVFFPERSALYILEVNAGFAKSHNFNVGDVVQLEQQSQLPL